MHLTRYALTLSIVAGAFSAFQLKSTLQPFAGGNTIQMKKQPGNCLFLATDFIPQKTRMPEAVKLGFFSFITGP